MADEVALRLRSGQSYREVGRHFGVSDVRIYQVVRAFDIDLAAGKQAPESDLRLPTSKTLQARQKLVSEYGDQWGQVQRQRRRGKSLVRLANEVARP